MRLFLLTFQLCSIYLCEFIRVYVDSRISACMCAYVHAAVGRFLYGRLGLCNRAC